MPCSVLPRPCRGDQMTRVAATGVPRAEIAVLGVLTIVAYGSWFYGFGVLLDDIAADLGSGVGVLTVGYALAQVLTGMVGLVVGRLLDRRGATAVFTIGAFTGPVAIVLASTMEDPLRFAIWFGLGGGLVGATGFYHLTQSIAARVSPGREARAIARLTIWGAFSSPLLIPLTEVSRRIVGWRITLRLGALVVAVVLAFSGNVALAVMFVILAGTGIGAVSPLEGIYAREVLPADDLGTLMGALHLLLGIAAGVGPLAAAMLVDLTGSARSGPLVAAAFLAVGVLPLVTPARGQRFRGRDVVA